MSVRAPIAVLIGAAWPENDASGPVQSVRQIATRLGDTIRFELFARSGPPGEPPLVAHGTRVAASWGGITYLEVGPAGAHGLAARLRALQPGRIWLNSMWDREFTLPALLARRAGRLPRLPVLLSTRGEFSSGALALHPGRKRALLALLRHGGFLRGVTLHVTGSAEAADVARALPEARILDADNLRSLSPLPVHAKSSGEVLRLLYLGRISPVKGLHNAFAALAQVARPIRLTINGPVHDRAYATRCHALAAALPKHVSIDWRGPLANRDVEAAYAATDLFLNPSASENFGHTIFESLACGTPVLTGLHTPWNGLEEDCAGYNRASDDPSALAAAITAFAMLDPPTRLQWRAAARVRAERFVAGQVAETRWRSWLDNPVPAPSEHGAKIQASPISVSERS